jgi:DNA-binding XRE family transcriptional regulator
MHKSHIILLDNNRFWDLNRNQKLASLPQLTNTYPEYSWKSKRCDDFFNWHKTMVPMVKNSLKEIRESLLMSKSELAREANVSPITITRIEEGKPCRLETKRKILLALGYSLSDSKKLFGK